MTDTITPLLKAAIWVERVAEHGLLLAPLGAQMQPPLAPVVAYAIDQGETMAFLSASEVNVTPQATIHESALASLRQRLSQLDWAPVADYDRVLILAGDFHAAEGLLLPERLQEAHALLQAPALLACTPKRGVLLVGAYDGNDKASVEAFVELCYRVYYSEADESVSPVIWGVGEGRLKDALQLDSTYLGYLQERYGTGTQTYTAQATRLDKAAQKVMYSPGQITFMTLFGTLLAGLYAMASNYEQMGMRGAVRVTWLATLVLVPLNIFWFMEAPHGPYDKLYPLLPALFLTIGSQLLQGVHIRQVIKDGGRFHRVRRQCLVIALALLTMVPVVALLISFGPG